MNIEKTLDLADAMQRVIDMARSVATTKQDKEACDIVEDFVVNHLGDDK